MGTAEAGAIKAKVDAAGGPDKLIELTYAEGWGGQYPLVTGGGGSNIIDLRSLHIVAAGRDRKAEKAVVELAIPATAEGGPD